MIKKLATKKIKICSLLYKENTKSQKIRSSSNGLKHESLASSELSVSHKGQKRNTEGTDSDVEYISETKVMKKSTQKKGKQQQRHPAAQPENVKLAERSQVGFIYFFFSCSPNV